MILYKNKCAVAPSQHTGLSVQAGERPGPACWERKLKKNTAAAQSEVWWWLWRLFWASEEKKVKVLLVWCLQSWTHGWGVLVPQNAQAFCRGKIHIYTSHLRAWALKCAVRDEYSPEATVLFLASVNCRISRFQSLFTDLWVRINDSSKLIQSVEVLHSEKE